MAEKISRFEMKYFQALNTRAIYLNISKIRVLIQITPCRNAIIQMDLSNNSFSAEEAKNYIPGTEKRKKVPVCEILEFSGSLSSSMLPILSWKLNIIAYRGNSTIPPSSKLELLCQNEMTTIVTKTSIIYDLRVRDLPIVCFLCKTLPKKLKLNEVDIYMFKVKKKGTRTRCEIYPELIMKAPRQR